MTLPDWKIEWSNLAHLTNGVTSDDPRRQPILVALEECDRAYKADDWPAFQRAAEWVCVAVEGDGEQTFVGMEEE